MLSFNQFLVENSISSLSIFDIDDTLFKTDTKVIVKKNNKKVIELNPAEYNVYKLGDGESFDFSQFRSSSVFAQSAKPIDTVFKTAKKILAKFTSFKQKKVVIITARADLDDKNLFLDTFRKYGFNIDKVHVFRAGNMSMPGPAAKAKIAGDQLKSGNYSVARMFDDHDGNLDAFLSLKQQFPNINFEAFLVDKDNGNISRYH
jgi:hypothetical protein